MCACRVCALESNEYNIMTTFIDFLDRRTARRDVTRKDLLELPLETSPPTLDDNDATKRFSGRAGE